MLTLLIQNGFIEHVYSAGVFKLRSIFASNNQDVFINLTGSDNRLLGLITYVDSGELLTRDISYKLHEISNGDTLTGIYLPRPYRLGYVKQFLPQRNNGYICAGYTTRKVGSPFYLMALDSHLNIKYVVSHPLSRGITGICETDPEAFMICGFKWDSSATDRTDPGVPKILEWPAMMFIARVANDGKLVWHKTPDDQWHGVYDQATHLTGGGSGISSISSSRDAHLFLQAPLTPRVEVKIHHLQIVVSASYD